MSAPKALQKIRDSFQNAGVRYGDGDFQRFQLNDISVARFSYTSIFEYPDIKPESFSFRINDLPGLSVSHWSGTPKGYKVQLRAGEAIIRWENHKFEYARAFVDAVNALRYYASGADVAADGPLFAGFQEQALAWRTLAVKPALPDDARRFKVLAEDAIQSKNFEQAVEYYAQGLAISPLWPDGQFNAALLYGELQIYGQAVLHMKRYLALVPEAKDAQAARDKMQVWEEKLRLAGAQVR